MVPSVGRRVGDKISRPPYFDIKDTTVQVGITRRQLGYWLEKDLLVPEYGPGARRFSARDLWRLRWLKRVIFDLGLPVELVKRATTNAPAGDVERYRYF